MALQTTAKAVPSIGGAVGLIIVIASATAREGGNVETIVCTSVSAVHGCTNVAKRLCPLGCMDARERPWRSLRSLATTVKINIIARSSDRSNLAKNRVIASAAKQSRQTAIDTEVAAVGRQLLLHCLHFRRPWRSPVGSLAMTYASSRHCEARSAEAISLSMPQPGRHFDRQCKSSYHLYL